MGSVYKRLAEILDRIPEGFPETESGVELKILQSLFSEEHAELACHLELTPMTAKQISERIGWEERKTFVMLKTMLKKGLIDMERGDGGMAFKLIPFIVGFYEHQNANISADFAKLFEQYFHEGFHKMMKITPSFHRVIPVNKTVPVDIEVMPYESATDLISKAKSWGVLKCICRVQQEKIGKPCGHTIENCVTFSSRPNAYDRNELIRAITFEEAVEILEKAKEEGLVHTTKNVRDGNTYICNCCTCGCGILRGIAEYGEYNSAARSNFIAKVDESACTGCELCLDRCQFKALEIDGDDNTCKVDEIRCYGCGQCVTVCPSEALSLQPLEKKETPPETLADWREKRKHART